MATQVKSTIKHTVTDLSEFVSPGTELLGVNIPKNYNSTNTIANCYISSNQINTSKLAGVLEQQKNTYIFGDLNSKLDIPEHDTTNPNGDKLQTSIDSGDITAIYPSTYTRIDPGPTNSSAILDYVLTNEEKYDPLHQFTQRRT